MQAWHALAPAATIHLSMTLCGGQCFRWRKTPRGTWVGVVRDNAYELCNPREVVLEHGAGKGGKEGVSAAMSLPFQVTSSSSRTSSSTVAGISSPAETLWFRCLNKVPTDSAAVEQQVMFLRHYLALDIDLEKMWRRWTKENPMGNHPLVRALISCGLSDLPVSIRHLRQDLHETLLTFLCSQNNNIQRITGLVERLAASYGDFLCEYNMATGDVRHIPGGGHGAGNLRKRSTRDEWTALYSLPSMAQLAKAKEEELKALALDIEAGI
uniref:Putative 8-oxoguanine DNA glycosylase n=1 Tax=Trypanosoma congolense (strain IL3000) TaxID=1068625 RepID=G0UL90_TRYCI|nr:putative 8-oxoguanine DNA glycosylase [Trypanosoma congolense IL3000]